MNLNMSLNGDGNKLGMHTIRVLSFRDLGISLRECKLVQLRIQSSIYNCTVLYMYIHVLYMYIHVYTCTYYSLLRCQEF